ncbi:MAG: DNA polymerase III subunit delta' [Methylophaga sp.]|nr:DNA polymerase III subunit delta' [Methylophaga sp.]
MHPWNQNLWQRFCQQQQQQRLPHALLLSGVAGLGKQQFAKAIVANVLCMSLKNDNSPCGQCHSCQLLSAGNHPDHIEIMPEEVGKQIKIDQIRGLKEKQQLTTSVASWKSIIISPADAMNVSANNSLLKLLEEPQQNTLLILVSDKPERLPITIRSRCQSYPFSSPPTEQALAWLATQNVNNQNDELEKILQLASGAPIKVLEMLDANINEQYQQIERDFDAILSGQANPIALATSWKNFELSEVLQYLHYLIKKRLIELMKTEQKSTKNRHYLKISDCIMSTIKLTSSLNNVNKTLLTEDFIVSVMQITHNSEYKVR